jgi:hypothetical protein
MVDIDGIKGRGFTDAPPEDKSGRPRASWIAYIENYLGPNSVQVKRQLEPRRWNECRKAHGMISPQAIL